MQTITYYCDLCNAKIIYGKKHLLIADIADDDGEEDIMETDNTFRRLRLMPVLRKSA